MAAKVYLVRHAESEHNVSKDFSQLDPSLTALGYFQASQLIHTLPNSDRIATVLSSPLRRAIQTSLAGFPHILDKRYFGSSASLGVENGIELILDPDLQERSAFPCDTGSERQKLGQEFSGLDLEGLSEGWPSKLGQYAADDDAIKHRASRMREKLQRLEAASKGKAKRDIVVVTHGVFMKFLSGEDGIDLPKAGWKAFTIENDNENRAILTPIEEAESVTL
jgi:broad specificity phosphatase PhoE